MATWHGDEVTAPFATTKRFAASTFGIRGDISNAGDRDRIHGCIRGKKGRLDVLFANALS